MIDSFIIRQILPLKFIAVNILKTAIFRQLVLENHLRLLLPFW